MYLSPYQLTTLSHIMQTLAEPYQEAEIRSRLGEQLMVLFNAQYFASYVWRDGHFSQRVQLNIDTTRGAQYEAYFQYCDPISESMRKRGRATRVSDVMPYAELQRTEFYNDFLRPCGGHWGMNLHVCSDDNQSEDARHLADFRIWRNAGGEDFSASDVALLDMLQPALSTALRRARGDQATPAHAGLTQREYEVARLIANGLSDKLIARELDITVTTIRTHLKNAFRKLQVNNRVSLIQALKF